MKTARRKLRRLHKNLSRKKRGSRNREKARKRLAKAYRRIRNIRKDVLHKATTQLTKNHGRIVIEDLRVQNMARSGRGLGRAAKAGLNRGILDASFYEFRRMLEYKGKLYGCEVVAVNPAYTSQTCPECGCVDSNNRKTQADFTCVVCGYSANADYVAARNVLLAGSSPESQNACGVDVRQPASAECN